MGPGPFGAAWPSDEPYPKSLPAPYDVRPAPWTLAVGFRFQPLWPGVRGEGAPECRATTGGSCMAEVGLGASLDARLSRLLFTAHTEAVTAGDASRLQVGGRVALDLFGLGSVFSEGLARLPLGPEAQRTGLVLLGGGLRGFRSIQFQAWYGLSFGGSGEHLAGAVLDVPIAVVWDGVQTLSASTDPWWGQGWIYNDQCAPMFALSANRAAAAGIKPGAHLWQCGNTLYHDRACTEPAVPVEPRKGSPPPVTH